MHVRWIPFALAVVVFLSYSWAALPSTGYPLWFRASGLEAEAQRLFGGWDWQRMVGLRSLYSESLALTQARFSRPAPHLADGGRVDGRIMDLRPVYSHSHAPLTGHAFAFDMIYDPAGHRLLWDLFRSGADTILDLAHVGAIVRNTPSSKPPTLSHVRTFAPTGQLPVLHPRATPLPLAFIVPAAVFVEDEVTLFRSVVQATRHDFESSVFFLRGAAEDVSLKSKPAHTSPRPVLVQYHPRAGMLEVQVPQTGYLVISIPFHPSWKAFQQDGAVLPVVRANYAFMAVPIGAGPASIELRFDRSAWRLAVWFSRIGLVLLVAVAALQGTRHWRLASRVPP